MTLSLGETEQCRRCGHVIHQQMVWKTPSKIMKIGWCTHCGWVGRAWSEFIDLRKRPKGANWQ